MMNKLRWSVCACVFTLKISTVAALCVVTAATAKIARLGPIPRGHVVPVGRGPISELQRRHSYFTGSHIWVGLCRNCSAQAAVFSSAPFPVVSLLSLTGVISKISPFWATCQVSM